MPPGVASPVAGKRPKIRRGHSGCKTCRKRGKRCDETKPTCRACLRLKLECGYAVEYSFRNHDARSLRPRVEPPKSSPASTECPDDEALAMVNLMKPHIPFSLDCGSNLEASYWSHFHLHVRHLLPGIPDGFLEGAPQSQALRFAALCIAASNLSMLNAQVQHRAITNDHRRCVSSPLVNKLHNSQAQRYHSHALTRSVSNHDTSDLGAELMALVLLAYYHHASTDHSKFRIAVWDSVQFVLLHSGTLLRTAEGTAALQMWYRLCISHRLSKPPAFMLEDDLIYDILIKTIELRSRLVLFRCVGGTRHMPEDSSDIGPVAYEVLTKLLGRDCTAHEETEAEQSFVRGSNLVGLLQVQKERLQVWRSRIASDQLSCDSQLKTCFSRHRNSMNALYALLCEMMFEEANWDVEAHGTLASLADNICSLAATLDFTTSNTDDIYTFSLAEVLLQTALVWPSQPIMNYILDVIWPKMESKSRGYEHSHYPTHLVKRIINEIARYWLQDRAVTFAQLAVPENMPKLKLLDIDYPIKLVVGGYGADGGHFMERIPLP
ncbi:hypothetical protein BJX65DRAFT_174130 [Aspergillus insuetus]